MLVGHGAVSPICSKCTLTDTVGTHTSVYIPCNKVFIMAAEKKERRKTINTRG